MISTTRSEVEKGPAVVGCCASCARKGCKGVAATCGAVVEPVGGKKAHADRCLHKDHLVLSLFNWMLCMKPSRISGMNILTNKVILP